ncbi:UDP:flavonoid glycosyltransferase YjiC, YdhE family [Massilia sp. PDC64]|nr:nucleotide disphospho-sugar-binding domain-containing protein [Massilia sp. PDC64]SDF82277.1 UDP:flavonoid glycosyltransferase YjiC, YdhE family [Massilia sp. PDC64]
MANIVFCWELGAALGHAGRLKALARPLVARGHAVSFVLRDLVHTRRLLEGTGIPVYQAPLWLHRVEGLPPGEASLADILLACGWLDADAMAGLVDGWRHLFGALRADVVVGDYAPAALLAARSLGIASSAVGAGFQIPPAGPLPPLRDWEAIPQARMAATEARVLATANAVLARHGVAPYARAADLLRGDMPLLCTWPELDPWGRAAADERWVGPTIGGGAAGAPAWPDGDGPRVFAYLRGPHPEHGAMLEALVRAGCRTLCYLPDVAAGAAPPYAHELIAWAAGPVGLRDALSVSAFAVCHAGESTVSQALLAGVPLLLLPRTAEAFLTARRVRRLGAGINVNEVARPLDWNAVVGRMLEGSGFRVAAQDFARRHAEFDAARQAETIAGVLEGLVRRPAAAPVPR